MFICVHFLNTKTLLIKLKGWNKKCDAFPSRFGLEKQVKFQVLPTSLRV
jgi:hypothetical protein